MKPSAFARFEAALGKEHRARTEKEIELGFAEPRKDPRKTGRPRKSGGEVRPDRKGKVPVEFDVHPRATAAMALTAARNGTTTNAEFARWVTTLAIYGNPPETDPRVKVSLSIAVGTDAFPDDLFRELIDVAAQLGCEPGHLACAIIRENLAKEGRITV